MAYIIEVSISSVHYVTLLLKKKKNRFRIQSAVELKVDRKQPREFPYPCTSKLTRDNPLAVKNI